MNACRYGHRDRRESGVCRECERAAWRRYRGSESYRVHARAAQAKYKNARQVYLNEIKLSAGCADCGYAKFAVALGFDHRPDETKCFTISANVRTSMEKLRAEVAKCDVVCANCHRVRTHITRRVAK